MSDPGPSWPSCFAFLVNRIQLFKGKNLLLNEKFFPLPEAPILKVLQCSGKQNGSDAQDKLDLHLMLSSGFAHTQSSVVG